MKSVFATRPCGAVILAWCMLVLLAPALPAGIVVQGGTVLHAVPPAIGGAMIEYHDYPSPFVSGNTYGYQADFTAMTAKGGKLMRMGAYPDTRTNQTLAQFDLKVKAIRACGATPMLYVPIKTGTAMANKYYTADGMATTGTIASNAAYLVKHYRGLDTGAPAHDPDFAANPVPLIYLEVGNEPGISVDYLATPTEYMTDFTNIHNALVAAGLRDYVKLCGPVAHVPYKQGITTDPMYDVLLANCHDMIDVVTFHHYANSSTSQSAFAELNKGARMDGPLDPNRIVTSTNYNWGTPTCNMGVAGLIKTMTQYTYARGVGLGITEHNFGGLDTHGIAAGVYNLINTHYLLVNKTGIPSVLDCAFIFDQYGTNYGFGMYNADHSPDYAWWAMWIRDNLRGGSVLDYTQSATGGLLNAAGYPYLLPTATRDPGELFVEVVNRNQVALTDTITISGLSLSTSATVHTMANGVYPDAGTGTSLNATFSYTFPAMSAVIFRFPIQKVAAPTLDLPAGTYNGAQQVTIQCATAGAEIRYTLDGSEPTAASPLYTYPIDLDQSCTVKARAFKAGMQDSDAVAAAYVIQLSLLGRWEFDGDFADLGAAPANTGTAVNGATLVTGTKASGTGALNLDGVNDCVTVADEASLRVTGALTLAANIRATNTGNRNIVAKSFNDGYRWRLNGSGCQNLIIGITGTSSVQQVTSTAVVSSSAWHHVAVTLQYTGTVGTATFYLDGAAQDTRTFNGSFATEAGTGALVIGARAADGSEPFGGQLDDVRVYNRVLTAAEIGALVP